jgi:acyl carrier protein
MRNEVPMTISREELQQKLLRIFEENFEIKDPGLDDDLREAYDFDSIDAIGLLVEIERIMGVKLSQEEKKRSMDIRTINHICDYVEALENARS